MPVRSRAEVDQKAGSQNEKNYGYALLEYKQQFEQQYFIGVPGLRGTTSADFVVYTAPQNVAVFVDGAYWHGARSKSEDQLKRAAAAKKFFVMVVSEAESATLEAAKAHVRKNFA